MQQREISPTFTPSFHLDFSKDGFYSEKAGPSEQRQTSRDLQFSVVWSPKNNGEVSGSLFRPWDKHVSLGGMREAFELCRHQRKEDISLQPLQCHPRNRNAFEVSFIQPAGVLLSIFPVWANNSATGYYKSRSNLCIFSGEACLFTCVATAVR